MKYLILYFPFIAMMLLVSCVEKPMEPSTSLNEEKMSYLPFQELNLNSMENFKKVSKNWKIAGNAFVDRNQKRTMIPTGGKGLLLNLPEKGMNENLFTSFDHGDIELELDVMMPVNSNSGIYFQGRYEVQLFDSWGVENAQHSDIGGIYQRWDDNQEKGSKGFEGHAPKLNAAKAPGLWQHFKIIFQAPKFNSSGKKIKNARFEEIWLNGALVHENVEITGPTRAAAFLDEQALGPLMIQGDHGPVALRNIKYKLYQDNKVVLRNLQMKVYKSTSPNLPNLDSISPLQETSVDSISSMMAYGENPQQILVYTGKLVIPNPGDYLFELRVNNGGGVFLIGKDTIANLNGIYNMNSPSFGSTLLQKGEIPFTFIYNKHISYQGGFTLYVEGPQLAKHPLHEPGSFLINKNNQPESIIIQPNNNETVIQRSFIMHEGEKRTHCISVGTPQNINYAFDLQFGSLLLVWDGDFLDATKMWHSRGNEQLGDPLGLPITIHGDPDFAFLINENSIWPDSIPSHAVYQQLGYKLDATGNPKFSYKINGSVIFNKFIPSTMDRGLNRIISANNEVEIWHKIAEGNIIEKLPDGTFAINDKNYFIDFSGNSVVKPIIRNIKGKDELIVKIPKGNQEIKYSIIW